MNVSIASGQDSAVIIMNAGTKTGLGAEDSVDLCFGLFRKTLSIVTDNSLEAGQILLPGRLSDKINIPNLPYEARWEGRSLHLGPVIGFMNNILFYNNPHLIKTRFCKYSEIKGLILIFAPRHVDTRRRLIHGKYYDPGSDTFIEVTAPYPSAVYLRTDPPVRLYRHLKAQLGAGYIYNYPFRSNKWVFWRLARKYPEVERHLPETREYVSAEDALDMLRKYEAVYLKPYNLSRGRGIYRLSRGERGYLLADTYSNTWQARDRNSLEQLLTDKLRRNYLVQQEISYVYYGHKIDYRIYLQKNKAGQWEYRGLDTKIANQGSINSNSRNRQKTLYDEEGPEQILGLDKQAATKLIDAVMQVSIEALKAMEANGHVLGDVAIDFALDQDQKIWLLEVQPDHFSDVLKIEHYVNILQRDSFDYAKALTGF